MKLGEVKNTEFREKGYMVVRNVLSPVEVEMLRQRADAIAADLDGYRQRDQEERARIENRYRTPASDERTKAAAATRAAIADYPEIRLTDRHARREDRVYPTRRRAVDEAERQVALATDDPYAHFEGQISFLADNDEYFRSIAAHPNIVAILNEVLSPNVKLWFDHIFNKPPYNDNPPYGGANRYHQDGFFHLDRRSVTCWISLDGLTLENGPFHYIPITAGYGQSKFDELGETIAVKELEQEEVITLNPGDAAFHDRWTVHATGANESPKRRRGWALHYGDAEAKFGEYSGEATDPTVGFEITPEGYHVRDGNLSGRNRHWHLVSGREFPGCI